MAGIADLRNPTAAKVEELIMLVSEYPELYNMAIPSYKDNQKKLDV